ncbi:flotillin-like protein 6 [Magnolia sinica]|uniref:flotillin-like protein 6 n=1 Tax=Magnolia sinica TaxID=86752 RepID=UPI00265A187B|nr:flotillin-like protein 6 [Magnolia sinica]
MTMSFKVAKASEYLVITGARIPDIRLARKAWVWPGQRCTRISISPVNYSVQVHAMSSDKLAFLLSAVFTIGPRNDMASLLKYIKLMPSSSSTKIFKAHIAELVNGIIQGEARVLAASMTIEEIVKGTKQFKHEVFDKIQSELNHFGLFVYNANVKELVDTNGRAYFYNLTQKIQGEAACKARLDANEVDTMGKMEMKCREAKVIQNAARCDTETSIFVAHRVAEGKKEEKRVKTEAKVFENRLEGDLADSVADLDGRKAVAIGRAKKAQMETQKANAIREAKLQLELEKKAALVSMEKLRADLLNKATVEFEAKIQETNSKFFQQQKYTDALFYAEQKDAEVKKILADVEFHVKQRAADANLYAKKREAEALIIMSDAHSYHVRSMLNALGGNYSSLRDYMMINNGMYKEIAKINAESMKGLKPKIYILGDGKSEICGGGPGPVGPAGYAHKASSIYKMPPPLMEYVQDQTAMTLPMSARHPAAAGSNGEAEQDVKCPVGP